MAYVPFLVIFAVGLGSGKRGSKDGGAVEAPFLLRFRQVLSVTARPHRDKEMINKKQIQELLRQALETMPEAELFEVSVSVSPKNEIKVYIDGMKGVAIDSCVAVSRYMEQHMDREAEDFELTVSSSGLDQPLRVARQYQKNIAREVKVTTNGGETLKGTIESADEEGFSIKEKAKKTSRAKESKTVPEEKVRTFKYAEIKETKIVISFK